MRAFALLSFLTLLCGIAAAEPPSDTALPLWEAGLVGGGGYTPDYPAADQNHWRGLGSPYVIYRGNILRADRDGARARLLRTNWFHVEFSAAGSFPARSRDNAAREGMPDLDWLGEVGPRLAIPVWKAWGYTPLKFYVPVRAVFGTDFSHFKYRGYTITPNLSLRLSDFWKTGWIGLAQLSSNFGDRMINGYFYDVDAAFVRPGRPAYDSRAGYIGSDFILGLMVPLNHRVRLFLGGQVNLHSGSANADSPLFRRTFTGSTFFGLGWTFYESKAPSVPFD